MKIVKCWLVENDCYKAGKILNPPTKIVVHSTGANNKTLKRYVQPVSGQNVGIEMPVNELIAQLGKNPNGNSWNRTGTNACVNAFIGTLADGTIAVANTLPWDMRAWGVGRGTKGSYNDFAIQFEICEDDTNNATYCRAVFEEAAQLCAFLINKYPNIKVTDIVSHAEAHKLGFASNHGDPDSWWKKHGLTMDEFRKRVQSVLDDKKPDPIPQTTALRYYYFKEINKYYKPTIQKLIDKGLFAGKGGSGADMIVDMGEDMCRVLTMLDRAGLFGE